RQIVVDSIASSRRADAQIVLRSVFLNGEIIPVEATVPRLSSFLPERDLFRRPRSLSELIDLSLGAGADPGPRVRRLGEAAPVLPAVVGVDIHPGGLIA